ncbi:MAG TPA: hypothetical protein DD670_12285, partial [Planctomycetaceae bacterium]|nr:hypothetical protein [Planctomycetaceae bacterium]
MLHHRHLRVEWLEDRSLLSVAPTAVDLLPVSDTGIFNDDNLTNLDNSTPAKALQFEVAGTIAGATVTLYTGTTPIGTAVATSETTTVTTNGAFDLADGGHEITARQTEMGDTESSDSPPLTITVDMIVPLLTGQVVKLSGAAGDYFGYGVAIDGTTAIVGVPFDDDGNTDSGSAYVFEETGLGWVQVVKLTASDGAAGDHFGQSVSISGTTAIIGASGDDDRGTDAGSVYIFQDSGTGWVQVAKLTADDGANSDFFGCSVSISGTTAIIGAVGDDDKGVSSGSVYIFQDSGSGWVQVVKLTANDGANSDYFGRSVSISGATAIVGAYGNDDHGDWSGSAYIFQDMDSGWIQRKKLIADDGATYDYFGRSVCISGTTAIIGADGDDSDGSAYIFQDTGSGWVRTAKLTADDGTASSSFGYSVSISGNQVIVGDHQLNDAGAAYLFENTGSYWVQSAKLTAVDGATRDSFGYSVSIDGVTAIVGAYEDDDHGSSSGSAYIFGPFLHLADDTGVSSHDEATNDATPTLSITFTESIYGRNGDVTILDPNSDPVVPDSITGWGSDTLVIVFSEPLTVEGEYTVTLSGMSTITDVAGNAIQNGENETVTFTLDTVAPTAPAAPNLQMASDTGISNSDNITSDNTPTFDIAGAPYFRLYRDGVQISDDCQSGGSLTLPPQPDGTYEYTATAVDAAGNESAQSEPLVVTIDTQAPPVPPALDLQAASDSGLSDSDNVTNDNTPTFDVSAAPYFRLYHGVSRMSGLYETGGSYTTVAQPDGTCDFAVTAVDAAGNESAKSVPLAITIEVSGPFLSDQVAKLTASDGAASDLFGFSVSVSGKVAIVGAYQDDDMGSNSGSAYIFENIGSDWVQLAKLTASDGVTGDYFGSRVAVSGSVAVVGAYQDDDKGSNSGSAYIFEDTGSGWIQVAKLTAADGAASDNFGNAVAIEGNTVLVAAYQDDDKGSNSGSVYVFRNTGSSWVQNAKLTADDGAASDWFGSSVAISGSLVIVGANGDDDKGSASGSAYIFESTDSGWVQAAKLMADDGAANDWFGYSVSISGGKAVVGAYQDDDKGSNSGSAYIFESADSGWVQVAKLTADDGVADDHFGSSVSISDSMAMVGAYGDDDKGADSGSAYIFHGGGSVWPPAAKLSAADGAASHWFGYSVAISGNTAIVGAYGDDNKGVISGSAYVFDVPPKLTDDTGLSAYDRITYDTTPELTFAFNEPVFGQDADVTVLDPNLNPLAPDSVTGWGSNTLMITFSTPLTTDGEYTVTLNSAAIYDTAGNPLNNGEEETITFTLDTVAPVTPAAPCLQAVNDSGISDTDGMTNDSTPTFDISASPCFRLYRDGVRISGDYRTVASYTDVTLSDNTYEYTVTAVDLA